MTITIAVDAMGGDVGLAVTAPAAAAFLRRYADARLIMAGDGGAVQAALSQEGVPLERVDIVHTTQVVDMDELPQHALKNKKDSSMRVAVQQVKEGRAQAAVSAGNTGALMATARFVLKTLDGIDRPAIAKFMPADDGHRTLMLDLGANADCTPGQLVQFAVMGSALVHALNPQCAAPRVGLLNIGAEEMKGTDTVKQAFQLLRGSCLNFVGNVEANHIFSAQADVVVADGFVGNVVLKTVEGTVKFTAGIIRQEFKRSWMTKLGALAAVPVLHGFRQRLDPRRYNGAIFLGLRGVVVKSHGGTDAVGFEYALEEAYHQAQADSINRIACGVSALLATQPETAAHSSADSAAVNE